MAELAFRGIAEARPSRDAQRRQFRADPFPRGRRALGRRRRRVSPGARLYPAPRGRLRLPERAARDGRQRGSQPRCRCRADPVPERLKQMSEPLFEKIALIGIGLIGSSLARVIRREALARHIAIATRSADTLARAEELGLGDSYTTDL